LAKFLGTFTKSEIFVGVAHCALRKTIKRKAREQRSS